MIILGVDIGGTFTDITVIDLAKGRISNRKVLSTPDPSRAVVDYLSSGDVDRSALHSFVHGSTVGTNAVIEKKGARLGLITTAGHGDRIDIQRTNLLRLYDLAYRKPAPLVARGLRAEVRERIRADGSILEPLHEEDVAAAVEQLLQAEVEAIAVCFLSSYANPVHEERAVEIVRRHAPAVKVIASSQVLPEIHEYERFSTALVSAFLLPVIDRYVSNIEREFSTHEAATELLLMQGNGGVMSAAEAKRNPVTTLSSGPAAGVIGGAWVAGQAGHRNVITFDMGGTSTDVSLILNGEPALTTAFYIEGLPMRIPMVDVYSVGAGGGSLAWIDTGGGLHVGPESAGSTPGPACYGLGGTRATVSDAQAVLGRLSADRPLGGHLRIDASRARTAIEPIAHAFGMSVEQAALGILRIADTNMANAVRVVSVEKGFDPRDFVLMAFGGAGAMHAIPIAEELGITEILVPYQPGTFCSLGLTVADLRHDFMRSVVTEIGAADPEVFEGLFQSMEREGRERLAASGVEPAAIETVRSCDLRYVGQAYVPVSIPVAKLFDAAAAPRLAAAFHQRHLELYKHSAEGEPVEVVSLRVSARGLREKRIPVDTAADTVLAPASQTAVFFDAENGFVDCPVYDRVAFGPGATIDGPALITQMDTTIVVFPGYRVTVDAQRNLILRKLAAAR
ncbi:MAG: hydantoinase/oxoprolinase family protein [Gammaproteobacteria bacterium]|nr:hydantoinase/oxoprolinase family protein [Gammaproteobacteria bacterium]